MTEKSQFNLIKKNETIQHFNVKNHVEIRETQMITSWCINAENHIDIRETLVRAA